MSNETGWNINFKSFRRLAAQKMATQEHQQQPTRQEQESLLAEESKERQQRRKVNPDFFSIGAATIGQSSLPPGEDDDDKEEPWRNIKPNQNVDALNKEVFKKRKYQEFKERQARFEASQNRRKGNYRAPKGQKRPKITPEMEEKSRIQNFIREISETLDSQEANDAFKASFRQYKMSQHPLIDDFAKEMFKCFLGEAEHAVCHLEVENYAKKRIILLRLAEQVQQRHRDRYTELTNCHLQACEAKQRTRNPFTQQALSMQQLKAKVAQVAQEAAAAAAALVSSQLSQSSHALQCCICYKSENLYEAKCRHIACLPCWEAWLEKALECPTCRQRTRKNQIYPVDLAKENAERRSPSKRCESQSKSPHLTPSNSQEQQKSPQQTPSNSQKQTV